MTEPTNEPDDATQPMSTDPDHEMEVIEQTTHQHSMDDQNETQQRPSHPQPPSTSSWNQPPPPNLNPNLLPYWSILINPAQIRLQMPNLPDSFLMNDVSIRNYQSALINIFREGRIQPRQGLPHIGLAAVDTNLDQHYIQLMIQTACERLKWIAGPGQHIIDAENESDNGSDYSPETGLPDVDAILRMRPDLMTEEQQIEFAMRASVNEQTHQPQSNERNDQQQPILATPAMTVHSTPALAIVGTAIHNNQYHDGPVAVAGGVGDTPASASGSAPHSSPSSPSDSPDASPVPTEADRLGVALNAYIVTACKFSDDDLWYEIGHATFPDNPHDPNVSPLEYQTWQMYYSDFAPVCLPLMNEVKTVEAGNKLWDAFLKCSKDKQPRLIHWMIFLITRVYYSTQFGTHAPNAFQSFCSYGLPHVTRFILTSCPYLCPPAEWISHAGVLRELYYYLFLVQSAVINLLEYVPLETHGSGLFDALDLTLNHFNSAPMKQWHRMLKGHTLELLKDQLFFTDAFVSHTYDPNQLATLQKASQKAVAHLTAQRQADKRAKELRRQRIAQLQQQVTVGHSKPTAASRAAAQKQEMIVVSPSKRISTADAPIVIDSSEDEVEEIDPQQQPQPQPTTSNVIKLPKHPQVDQEMTDAPPLTETVPGETADAVEDEIQEVAPSDQPRGHEPDDENSSVDGHADGEVDETKYDETVPAGSEQASNQPIIESKHDDDDSDDDSSDISVGEVPTTPAATILHHWRNLAPLMSHSWTRKIFSDLNQHFLALGGNERLVEILKRECTYHPPTPPTSQQPPSTAPMTNGSVAASPSPSPSAASNSKSASPDYPPIIHTAFAGELPATTMPHVCPSLMLIRRITNIASYLREHIPRAYACDHMIKPLFELVCPRIQYLTEQQIKSEPIQLIVQFLYQFIELIESNYFYPDTVDEEDLLPQPIHKLQVEQFEFEFAIRLFRSTYLEKRILGLRWLTRFTEITCSELNKLLQRSGNTATLSDRLIATRQTIRQNVDAFLYDRRAPAYLYKGIAADMIVQHNVIEILFGEQLHIQLLKRANDLLFSICLNNRMTAAHIELMWTASRFKHESIVQAIYSNWEGIAQQIRPRPGVYLYRRIYSIPLVEYDHNFIRMLNVTTRHLLGNWCAVQNWCHTHKECTFTRMIQLWEAQEKTHQDQQAGSSLAHFPYRGVDFDPEQCNHHEFDRTFTPVYLTHSSIPPTQPYDDYPPDGPPSLFSNVPATSGMFEVLPSRAEHYGLDLLWRAFQYNGKNVADTFPALYQQLTQTNSLGIKTGRSPRPSGNSVSLTSGANQTSPSISSPLSGSLGPLPPLTAQLRHECWDAFQYNLLSPFFEEPRPTCARRIQFMMLCVKNLQAGHNVYHSLHLIHDLIDSFSCPCPSDKCRMNAGRDWDERHVAIIYLNQRESLCQLIFQELQQFSQQLVERLVAVQNHTLSPEADMYSLDFWKGEPEQLKQRLDFISYIFTRLNQFRIHQEKEAAEVPPPSTNMTDDDLISPPPPPLVPVTSTPKPIIPQLEFGHIQQIFTCFIYPPIMTGQLRDIVWQWLASCITEELISDQLVQRIFHELFRDLNFSHLTSAGSDLFMQIWLKVNALENKIELVERTHYDMNRPNFTNSARRFIQLNHQSRSHWLGNSFKPEFIVLSYPIAGMEYLWRGALFAHDRGVSNGFMNHLVHIATHYHASLREEINTRYEEYIQRCMQHIHDCTEAIQTKINQPPTEMTISLLESPITPPSTGSSTKSLAECVSDLQRGFYFLNMMIHKFDGTKPISHEATMKQATQQIIHTQPTPITLPRVAPIASNSAAVAPSTPTRGGPFMYVHLKGMGPAGEFPSIKFKMYLSETLTHICQRLINSLVQDEQKRFLTSEIQLFINGLLVDQPLFQLPLGELPFQKDPSLLIHYNIPNFSNLLPSVEDNKRTYEKLLKVLDMFNVMHPAQAQAQTSSSVNSPTKPPTIVEETISQQSTESKEKEQKEESIQSNEAPTITSTAMEIDAPTSNTVVSIPSTTDQANASDVTDAKVTEDHKPPAEAGSTAAPMESVPATAIEPVPVVVEPVVAPLPPIHHPTEILSRPEYFDQLFDLLSLSIPTTSLPNRQVPLAEQSWKLLMQLPTNIQMLDRLKQLNTSAPSTTNGHPTTGIDWELLLPSNNLHKLHYSLQIIFAILPKQQQHSISTGPVDPSQKPIFTTGSPQLSPAVAPAVAGDGDGVWNADVWEKHFVVHGGMRHLVQVLVATDFSNTNPSLAGMQSVSLSPMPSTTPSMNQTNPANGATSSQTGNGSAHSQQTYECLGLLLKLILRFTHLTHGSPGGSHAATMIRPVAIKPTDATLAVPVAGGGNDTSGKKRKLVDDSPSSHKRRAIDLNATVDDIDEAYHLELHSVFTFDVVQKLFLIWQDVSAKPDLSTDTPFTTAAHMMMDDTIGPKTTASAALSATVGGAIGGVIDVVNDIVASTLVLLSQLLRHGTNETIVSQFFFQQPNIVRRWIITLLNSRRRQSLEKGQHHLIEIAHYWSVSHSASVTSQPELRHLSRYLFHTCLHLLLSGECDQAIIQHRHQSKYFMELPRVLLHHLQDQLVSSMTQYESMIQDNRERLIKSWSFQSVLSDLSRPTAHLQIDGLQLLDQLFRKVQQYPTMESFGSAGWDESFGGYISFMAEIITMLRKATKPKSPHIKPNSEETTTMTDIDIGASAISTDAAPLASTAISSNSSIPSPTLGELSPLSSYIRDVELIRCIWGELFDVAPINTPLDVTQLNQSPKAKHAHTRQATFNLLKQLSLTDARNFHALQELMHGQHEHDTSLDHQTLYAPETQLKCQSYVGLVNQGSTCYMNSLMQQLYMVPEFRYGILAQLSTDSLKDDVERQDSLMYQMQSIFGSLMNSNCYTYDAEGFCSAYKDWDGQPMQKGVQMDVNEFFNVLFDKLENCLKGSPHANLLDYVFGGKLSNQLFGRESSCSHQRERLENFYILSLDVKGKKNVTESLKSFVQGEMLEGDNKFQCSECNRKVDTFKRVCIKETPNNLILHLKRFEFDLDTMVKIKLNDFFEFPHNLDIYDYTSAGLAAADAKEQAAKENAPLTEQKTHADASSGAASSPDTPTNGMSNTPSSEATNNVPSTVAASSASSVVPSPIDRSNYEYELTGVIIHSGTAGSGHYYSYALERAPLPNQDHAQVQPQWFCFNDSRVEPFMISSLADQAYGGPMSDEVHYLKPYSAYMLFYQKKSMRHQPHPARISDIPRHIPNNQAVEGDADAVMEQLPEHPLSAKDAFAPLAKAAGLTIENASEHHHEQPAAAAAASSAGHKRKLSGASDASHSSASSSTSRRSDEMDPTDRRNLQLCTNYRHRVATSDVHSLQRCLTAEEESALLPPTLFEYIWQQNVNNAIDSYKFDALNLQFTWKHGVLEAYDFSPHPQYSKWRESDIHDRVQQGCIQLAINFIAYTYIHAKHKNAVQSGWDADLKRMLENNVPASRFFLDYLSDHFEIVKKLLFDGPAPFKKGLLTCVMVAIRTVRPFEMDKYGLHESEPLPQSPERPRKKRRRQTNDDEEEGDDHSETSHSGREEEEAGEDDEEEEEETKEDIEARRAAAYERLERHRSERQYRTSIGRFLQRLFLVSPTLLIQHFGRVASFYWQLLFDISQLGSEERLWMLGQYPFLLRAVQYLCGNRCKVQPSQAAFDPDEKRPVKLKPTAKLREKQFNPQPLMHLIRALLRESTISPESDEIEKTKMVDGELVLKALLDFNRNGFFEAMVFEKGDETLIPVMEEIINILCADCMEETGESWITDLRTPPTP